MKTRLLLFLRNVCRRMQAILGNAMVFCGFSVVKKVFSLHDVRYQHFQTSSGDLEFEILWPPSIQKRHLPRFAPSEDPKIEAAFAKEEEYLMPQGGIIRCQGFIVGEPAAIVTRNGTLLKEPSRQIAKGIFQHPVNLRCKLYPERKLKRLFFASFDQGSTFYHWLFDVLPLLLVPEFRHKLTPDTTVVCPPILYPYQRESLALAGLKGLEFLPTNAFRCIEAEEILVPVLPQTTGHQHHVTLEALRATFLPRNRGAMAQGERKIFISRRKALRGLSNESEILPLLESEGFEVALLEDMALVQQIALFAGADTVVAPHGAGLSHIAFMPHGSKVVELFSRDFINPCYWRLAGVCGHTYHMLTGSPSGKTARPEQDSYTIESHLLQFHLR